MVQRYSRIILLNSNNSELTGVKTIGIRKNKAANKKEIVFRKKLSSFIELIASTIIIVVYLKKETLARY
jgi:spore maturation protein SpmA